MIRTMNKISFKEIYRFSLFRCKIFSVKNQLSFVLSKSFSSNSIKKQTPFMQDAIIKIKPKPLMDSTVKSVKYITPVRTIKEYMLTNKDLEQLPRYFSRSPYSNEVKTVVFLRSDVEKLAFKKHDGEENFLMKQKLEREMERKSKQDIFNLRSALKFFQRPNVVNSQYKSSNTGSVFSSGSGRVVAFAIAVNGLNVAAKGVAWWSTGSKSMFSEMMHSIADVFNQMILAFGIYTAAQKPDEMHPYGYLPMQNVSSLISGVGIFFLGAGFTFYHGLHGLIYPHEVQTFFMPLCVMTGSLISESTTLLMAIKHCQIDAKKRGFESFRHYLSSGMADPSTSVVLLEDAAAVAGVLVASTAMAISAWTGQVWVDALGAIGVSAILAAVAGFIIHTNTALLIGKSISSETQDAIMRIVDNAKIIRGTYDIKATMLSGDDIRFKAEVDIDGRELTRRYLETLPLEELTKEMRGIQNEEVAIQFMLKHGDNIVNTLGAEINMIEEKIKKEFPSVKHIDIEIN